MKAITGEINEPIPARDANLGTSASLLGLPAELRLLIYRYLIPDRTELDYVSLELTYKLRPVRHDQLPCSPAMLRVNHQIYSELSDLWYGTTQFHMRIIWRALFIFGETITMRDAVLPRSFRLVRSLHISLNLETPQSEHFDSFKPPIPWMRLVVGCLTTGPRKLTELTLTGVIFTPRGITDMLDFWSVRQDIERVLEWNLGHLRTLRGVHLNLDYILPCLNPDGVGLYYLSTRSGYSRQAISRLLGRIDRVRARFLESLAEDMSKDA